jgi:hypothetical protein
MYVAGRESERQASQPRAAHCCTNFINDLRQVVESALFVCDNLATMLVDTPTRQ